MSKISRNIKKLRAYNGMTQEELAVKIHVTRQTVSSWETDRTQPDIGILMSLAEAFGVEVEEIIYGKRKNAAEEKEKLLFGNTLVTVLSVLGCLLIGAGVVMIFVKFWRSFPDALKLITCFVPALLGQGVGFYTYVKKKESLPWCEGASVLWLLGVIVTTSILLNNINTHYYIVSDCWMYMLYAVSAFILMLVFRTLSPLAVVQTCSVMWLNTILEDGRFYDVNASDGLEHIFKFIFIVLVQGLIMAAIFCASGKLYKKDTNIIRHTFASWINFFGLAAYICITVFRTRLEDAWISIIILATIACFIAGQKQTGLVSPYRALGLPASAAALCFLAIIFSPGHVSDQWVNMLMLGAGIVPIVFIFWKKTMPKSIYLRIYGALLTCALTTYNIVVYLEGNFKPENTATQRYEIFRFAENIFFCVSFLLCIAALIMLIVYGAKERKLLYLNIGFILSCFTVIAKLYLLDMGLIMTGILLIICGSVLLFINFKISKLREKERQDSLVEGEGDVQ